MIFDSSQIDVSKFFMKAKLLDALADIKLVVDDSIKKRYVAKH